MGRDVDVGLNIKANDQATSRLKSVTREAERQTKRESEAAKRAATDVARTQERATQRAQTAQARATRAREQLGIRSETRIRREIQLTQAAYNRLAQSGRLSAQEQGRAYDQMRNKVAGLRREMSGLAQQERRTGRGMNAGSMVLRGAGMLLSGGGITAAGYAIARPVQRTMTFEQRLAYMTNTAFSDRDKAGRLRGEEELKGSINNAVRVGGGTRGSAAETLDALLASGAMSQKDAFKLLPTLQKAATATGAAPSDLAQIAISGMQSFNLKASDIPLALDMATKAGQMGGFELKDMARWLPSMMAYAKNAGMSGVKDFGSLLTAAQASRITAGNADTAGNNLANWLAKLVSPDTQLRASKIQVAPGKSIDLQGTIAHDAARGVNALDSFVGIIGKVMSNDKGFQAMQARLRDPSLQGSDRRAVMEKQANILQGSIIGQLLPDRQGILALVGYMNNPKFRKNIDASYGTALGTNQANLDVISSTGAFKTQQLKNEAQIAEYDSVKNFSKVVGDAAGKLADLAKEYPVMTSYAVGAGEALRALAIAAGSVMLFNALRGRGFALAGAAGAGRAVASAEAGAAGAAEAGAAGAAVRSGSRFLPSILRRTGAGGPIMAGMGAYDLYSIYSSDKLTASQKEQAAAAVTGRTGGGLAGMYAGAAAGSLLGPIGTLVGGIGGAFGGSYLGDELGGKVGKIISAHKYAPDAVTVPVARQRDPFNWSPAATEGIPVHVTVDVKNGNITASVTDALRRDGLRH